MIIKQIRTLAIWLALFVGGQAIAQQGGSPTGAASELNQARVLLKLGRDDIVREEMRLSEAEATAFWPVYDNYQAELQLVRDRYADLLSNYLLAYRAGTVSKAMANQIVDDYLTIQSDVLKIKRKYLKGFRGALPARKAARFYQLENKMEAELEAELSLIVPLIDPV